MTTRVIATFEVHQDHKDEPIAVLDDEQSAWDFKRSHKDGISMSVWKRGLATDGRLFVSESLVPGWHEAMEKRNADIRAERARERSAS